MKKYANVDFNEVKDTAEAKKLADEHHIEYEAHHKKGDILNLFFEEYVEEHLIQPTFVMDHPIEISPLTKKKPENPDYVERFEFFMNGWEMANAYSELNDPEKLSFRPKFFLCCKQSPKRPLFGVRRQIVCVDGSKHRLGG